MFKKLLIISTLTTLSSIAMAEGLLRTTNLDKYCEIEPGSRQTVIYLDQNIIASKDPNWYKDILNKVKYRPGEKIQFVNINNGGSTVELIWETCYPSFTQERLKQLKENEGFGSLFTGGVADNLSNDQKFFDKQVIKALSYPLQKTRHETAPNFSSSSFPRKKLIEAFYYDSKRLNVDDIFSRVIIFSDMIENSELFKLDSFNPLEAAKSVAKRYPTFLNYSSFQIYGINYTNSETKINENIRDFWSQYFLLSGAYVEQYGAQLAVEENTIDWSFYKYKGYVQVNGIKGASAFRMIIGDDGKIRHGWLEIADMYLPVSGEVKCSGQNCIVDADILASSNQDAFRKKDVLKIEGTLKSLKGYVGGKDESVIDSQGNPYQHPINLSKF
ncbi:MULTISPECIES: hypothetical protein [Marinomonas]|uniref:Uncharacterized protein n=1 Tax=Marinomonas arctica TaxID=383750 RepID=A0A7H1J6X8_9GAMM|nr:MULTISPECIES: hypothetical protein [Marinomonas]MCS7485656.1 hypothetical protein [Marinomonas sp. BSi20414]QNT06244.1 hypothetical protein IBG28_00840 [Marinomonas arctica]GGN29201.1 hypothetical protein GCM10011350_21340 [Marinomonas arctica]